MGHKGTQEETEQKDKVTFFRTMTTWPLNIVKRTLSKRKINVVKKNKLEKIKPMRDQQIIPTNPAVLCTIFDIPGFPTSFRQEFSKN